MIVLYAICSVLTALPLPLHLHISSELPFKHHALLAFGWFQMVGWNSYDIGVGRQVVLLLVFGVVFLFVFPVLWIYCCRAFFWPLVCTQTHAHPTQTHTNTHTHTHTHTHTFAHFQGFLDVLESVDNGWVPPATSANGTTVRLFREMQRPQWTETRPIKRA